MLAWLRNWICREGVEAPGLEKLLVERRRLDELMASYRDFGFHTLIPECKRSRETVEQKIREMRSP